MVYPIVKYGDPVLERPAETVTDFDTPELDRFLEDMFESMCAAKASAWLRRRSASRAGSQ